MDFDLSAVQKDIQQAAREFAEKEFPDVARSCDANEEYPRALWKKACDLGFIGTFITEEFGGSGLGFFEMALIMEQFWRVGPGLRQCPVGCVRRRDHTELRDGGSEEKIPPPHPSRPRHILLRDHGAGRRQRHPSCIH